MGSLLEIKDNWNKKTDLSELDTWQALSPKFLKFEHRPIRAIHSLSLHMVTSTSFPLSLSISLSTSLFLLSPLIISRILQPLFATVSLPEVHTHQTLRKGGFRRSYAWSPSSGWWTVGPMQLFESPSLAIVFGRFQRRLTTFHGEATCFGMSSPSSTNCVPIDRRIIIVKKPITIHTVTSMAFSGESGKFWEVKPPKF